ncbi:MAG: efflux RND transporter periplasmic adaptor subunit [Bacteroidia bacterium]|nr:efflux RND transporter periplasmic adaptor subunit [Bacteroidia bacterium]
MKNIILVFTILLAASCTSNTESTSIEGIENAELQSTLLVKNVLASNTSVKIDSVQIKIVEQKIKCTGRVHIPPTEMISIHSKASGFIEGIKYLPGDYVKKGALLFTLVNPELIEKQRHFLESKAEYNRAEKEFLRKKSLFAEEATSKKAFEESSANYELLRAKFLGLKSELKLIGVNVKSLEEKQEYQSRLGIYAADAGYVHSILTNKGSMVEPHDKLMEIANDDHIHVELQVLAKDVAQLSKNQKVSFTLPNNNNTYDASIEKLNPMVDNETGTLNVHCHIAKDHAKYVKAGMFVNAEIAVDAKKVRGLPSEALIKEGEMYYAYVVKEEQLIKYPLNNPMEYDGFVSFDEIPFDQMLVAGAYYVE